MAEEIDLLDPSVWDRVSNQTQPEFLRQAEMMVQGTVTVLSEPICEQRP